MRHSCWAIYAEEGEKRLAFLRFSDAMPGAITLDEKIENRISLVTGKLWQLLLTEHFRPSYWQ